MAGRYGKSENLGGECVTVELSQINAMLLFVVV